MTGVTAFGWDNYALDATITANSSETALGPDNVANEWGAPQLAWQTAAGVVTYVGGALIKIAPRTPAQTWRAVCLQNTNLTSSATINIALWNDNGGSPTLVTSANATAPPTGYGNVCYVFSANQTADFVQIYFNDAGNPDGFINIPLIYCGPLWFPGTGRTFRSTFGRNDRIDKRATIGGTVYTNPRWNARWQRFEFDSTAAATELWTYAMELDRIARAGRNVLAIPDTTSTTMNQEAVFGLMETSSAMSFPMQTGELIGWNCRVEERL